MTTASSAAGEPTTKKRVTPQMMRWVAAAVIALLPMIVLIFSAWRGNAFLFYLGMLPALVALRSGPAVTLGAALAVPTVVFVGLLVSGSAALGTIFLVVLCAGVAWSYGRGWQAAATYVASQAALAVVAQPHTTFGLGTPQSPASAGAVAIFVLVGGLWIVLVGGVLLRDLPRSQAHVFHRSDRVRFAILLCGLFAVLTPILIIGSFGPNSWWVLLTILVVLEPDTSSSRTRAGHRIMGTVIGALLGTAVVAAVGDPRVVLAIGVVVALGSAIAFLLAPYWIFVVGLTMALICFSFTPAKAVAMGAERVADTLVAVLIVLLVGVVARALAPADLSTEAADETAR